LKDFLYNGDFEGKTPNVVACTDPKSEVALGGVLLGTSQRDAALGFWRTK
jgi:hypothetical protein